MPIIKFPVTSSGLELLSSYAKSKGLSIEDAARDIVLGYFEDQYDLTVFNNYLKNKDSAITFSHDEVWADFEN